MFLLFSEIWQTFDSPIQMNVEEFVLYQSKI